MKKLLLILSLSIFLIACKSINENNFRNLDKIYSDRIIGSWLVDTAKHTPIPDYIEY
jgi:hypothetical protein